MKNNKTLIITQTALLAALCFVTFTFLQIKIPVPGGDATSIHFGNVFLVLAALLIGGFWGGMAGAIGMTLADIMDPIYIVVAPKTFILKLCIGIIVGIISHKIGKISESDDKKHIFRWALTGAVAAMLFNVVADPTVGYLYKIFVLGQPESAAIILAKLNAGVTFLNAVTTVIIAVTVYMMVRPVLERSEMLIKPKK